MKKLNTILATAALSLAGISSAQAHDSLSFALNLGGYGYAPPPVVYYPPPPVVYYPRTTYYYSAPPVYYNPGATIVYRGGFRDRDDWDRGRRWGRGWGHGEHGHHWHDRD